LIFTSHLSEDKPMAVSLEYITETLGSITGEELLHEVSYKEHSLSSQIMKTVYFM
jgi:hypothetical protein